MPNTHEMMQNKKNLFRLVETRVAGDVVVISVKGLA